MPADMDISVQDTMVIARLTGEIDLSNAFGLEEAITSSTPNQALAVVLDLSALDYIDSAGIQLIYQLREQLDVRGQELKLVMAPGSPAADALRLAGVMGQFDVSDSLAQATH
jgi:anti-sigma B factor antagonist